MTTYEVGEDKRTGQQIITMDGHTIFFDDIAKELNWKARLIKVYDDEFRHNGRLRAFIENLKALSDDFGGLCDCPHGDGMESYPDHSPACMTVAIMKNYEKAMKRDS